MGPARKLKLKTIETNYHLNRKWIGFIKVIDLFECVFFGNVSKNSSKWVCLPGKILVSLPPVFCPIFDPPNAPIRQNPKMTQNAYKKKLP